MGCETKSTCTYWKINQISRIHCAQNYHPGTKVGDNTDYSKYNVLILEHLAAQFVQGDKDAG